MTIYEYGKITDLAIGYAGSVTSTSYLAGAFEIVVEESVDFDPDGGQVQINENVYTYLTYDPDTLTLTLDPALSEDVDEGEEVRLYPPAPTMTAHVQVDGDGSVVLAEVPFTMQAQIEEDIFQEGTEPTCELELIGSRFEVRNIRGQEVTLATDKLSHSVALPPQIIPEAGVTQFAQAVIEQAVIDRLQGKVAVIDELWVARYAPNDDGTPSTLPEPDSAVISMSVDDGFVAKVPTGDFDADGEPLYDVTMSIPTRAFDEEGNRIVAEFRGKIIADDVTVLKGVILQGIAADGDVSSVAPEAEIRLDNAVRDPATQPAVTFGPKKKGWDTATGDGWSELGWGVSSGNVVKGHVGPLHSGPSGPKRTVSAVSVNPATGSRISSQTLPSGGGFGYEVVGGFCAGGGVAYVLWQRETPFTPSLDGWWITRFDLSTGEPVGADKKTTVSVNIPASRVAMSYDASTNLVVVPWRRDNGNISIETFSANLQTSLGVTNYNINDSGKIVGYHNDGANGAYLLVGNKAININDRTRDFYSNIGVMSGFGALPSGQLAAYSDGTLAMYNAAKVSPGSLFSAYSFANTTTGKETAYSPVNERTWPPRTYATIRTDPPPPGTNDTFVYASEVSDAQADLFRVPKSPGQEQATIDGAPTVGTNPITESTFLAGGTPGRIRSQAEIVPGRAYTSLRGDGFASLLGLVLPWVHYNNAAGTSIPNNTFTVVPWPGAAVDSSGTGDFTYISGGQIQVNIPGVYEVSAQVTVAMPTGNRLALAVTKNGTDIAVAGDHTSNGVYGSARISGFKVRLAAGDKLDVRAHQNSGSAQSLTTNGTHNWVQLTRVHN